MNLNTKRSVLEFHQDFTGPEVRSLITLARNLYGFGFPTVEIAQAISRACSRRLTVCDALVCVVEPSLPVHPRALMERQTL